MRKAISLHLGLNAVDAGHYGSTLPLGGCHNDAHDMAAIARASGYEPMVLLDADASSVRLTSELTNTAGLLSHGDILLLSYAGHGAQVKDVSGDESDELDETWVLYDRMFLDDELHEALARFAAGVRVLLVSDSCHSGTVFRMASALALQAMGLADSASRAADVRFRTPDEPGFGTRIVSEHPSVYAPIRSKARGRQRELLRAAVIQLSACQDNQLAADGVGNGLFTGKLKSVWASGAFSGDHHVFLKEIAKGMPPTQTPAYQASGIELPEFERQRPFTVESSLPLHAMSGASIHSTPNNGVYAMNMQAIENDNWSDVKSELSRRMPGFQAPASPDGIYETTARVQLADPPDVTKGANGKNGARAEKGTSYLAAAPGAAPRAASGAPIVRAFWWGFHIECSSQGLRDFIGGASSVNDIAAAIGPVTGPAAPWVMLAAAFIAGALDLLQSLDRGNGVYISMSWFALGIFIPTTVPGGRGELGTRRDPSEPYEQAGEPWRRPYTGGAFGTRMEDDIYWNLPPGTVREEVIVHLNPPRFGNIYFNHWLSNDPTVGHFRLHVGIPMWVVGVVEIRMMIRDAEGRRSTVTFPTRTRSTGPIAIPVNEL